MFKNLLFPSVAVLFALLLSCVKPIDDSVQPSVTDIDIVSEDDTKQDTIVFNVTENDDTVFTVVYDGNGATGGVVPFDGNRYTWGDSVIVQGNNGNLVKTGYTFTGWNTAADGSGTDYAEGARYTTDAGVTLYAKWMPWIVTESTLTDPDGNVYTTVKIGTQVWTVENLKTTKYNDGTAIPLVTEDGEWETLSTPGYCWYTNNEEANKELYGALYNGYTVNTGKLAPSGWRVPTDEDWNILQNYLIANRYNYDGTTKGNKIGKAMAAQTGWSSHTKTGAIGNDLTKNNTSGFSALASGYRRSIDGMFAGRSRCSIWWSATDRDSSNAYYRLLGTHVEGLYMFYLTKKYGISVRLVRD